jgi:hypothetical protein
MAHIPSKAASAPNLDDRARNRGQDDMRGRLNRFQRAMLDWNELHPYNAVHVVRVAAEFDLPRLREAIQATLEGFGLTSLSVDREAGAFHYGGGPAASEITLIEEGGPGSSSLSAEIERQLNTAFPQGEVFNPFRFFIAPGRGTFSLGLAYFHPVADAESVVWLMKEFVAAYRNSASPGAPFPVELYPGRPGDRVLRHPVALARQIAALPAFVRILRSSCRPRYREAEDMRNGFTTFSLDSAALGSLRAAGKSWKVTLNDLFLALLMMSLAPLAAARRQSRRRKIAVGCIVNVRKELGVASQMFGLFLGSFLVAHEVPGGGELKDLAAAIRTQTERIKAAQLYLGTPAQLAFAGLALRFFSTRGKRSFYQKHCPLWGGITNMNLNTLWEDQAHDGPFDYLRAVSTGPVTPLVLSVTTVRERVNIGLSYRSTVFSTDDIGQVQSRLVDGVASLANLK